jgi:hypothetical protein
MGGLDREGLPRPIPAKELQAMLGSNPAFCSWDAWNSTFPRPNHLLAVLVFLSSHGQ